MTAQEIQKLKEENERLKKELALFKPQKHPATGTNYKFAFEIEGEKFYKWNTIKDIPNNRKIYIDGFIQATSLCLSIEDQREMFSKGVLLAERKDADAWKMLCIEGLKRIQLTPLPKMIFRLMAMLYLKEDDDLKSDLPSSEIERRSTLFQNVKKKTFDEIYSQPMSTLLGIKSITERGSKQYLKEREQLMRNLEAQNFIAEYSLKLVREL